MARATSRNPKPGEGLRYPHLRELRARRAQTRDADARVYSRGGSACEKELREAGHQGLRNKRTVASTRAAELRVVGVRSRALGAVH